MGENVVKSVRARVVHGMRGMGSQSGRDCAVQEYVVRDEKGMSTEAGGSPGGHEKRPDEHH